MISISLRENVIKGNLDNSYPKLAQPSTITNIILKEHQKTLLASMKGLENSRKVKMNDNEYFETNFGIIADKPGSGKSIVVLSLMADSLKAPSKNNIIQDYKNSSEYVIFYKNQELYQSLPVNLIVVNKILINQWTNYISSYTGFKYYVINDVDDTKKSIEFYKEYDIVLCCNKLYNDLAGRNFNWTRAVFDDVDTINITKCIPIHADFMWFISSSVHNICFPNKYYLQGGWVKRTSGITNVGFIREILFQLLNITDISDIFFKNRDKYIKESFGVPDPVSNFVMCYTPVEINILNNVVNKQIIQMLNAGDKFGALKELGFNVDNTDNIIDKILININKDISEQKEKLLKIEDSDETGLIVKTEKLISELEGKKKAIIERIKDEDYCLICSQKIQEKMIMTCCNNSFDFDCIQKMQYYGLSGCPVCREPIKKDKQVLVKDHTKKNTGDEENIKTKEQTTIDIINKGIAKNPESIFLLFSDFDASLEYLKDEFDKIKIEYSKIGGKISDIYKTIKDCNSGKIRVLLLNSKYYGSGLNLEFATDIIIYHRMEPDFENQIIGRAQRIGRTTPLNVYYLCHKNEID
jgi:SNF2 family DNA or RNA helicase